jgi:hypothetical protein
LLAQIRKNGKFIVTDSILSEKENYQLSWKDGVLFLFFLGAVVTVYFLDEIPEKPEWFLYADHRLLMGIANFGDVASNIFFIFIGAWGIKFLLKLQATSSPFEFSWERAAPATFFVGVFLTGIGSAWYHLDPTSQRLVWDRLPMTLAFMGIICMLTSDRIHPRAGFKMLLPLVILGMASVVWWYWTDTNGQGDLRPYAIVQFFPMLGMPFVLLLYPGRYTNQGGYWGILVCYAVAKIFELYDHEVYRTLTCVSGHSIKHMVAAVGAGCVLRMLKKRTLISRNLPGKI